MNFLQMIWACLITLFLSTAVWAGEGHDHDHDAEQVRVAAPSTPRFSAESEHFEMVGLLQGSLLTLYLDQRSDNAPVTKAQLLLEVDGQPLTLHEHLLGVYEAKVPSASGDEQHFRLQVIQANQQEVLSAELHLAHDEQHQAAVEHVMAFWLWGLIGILVLLVLWMGKKFWCAKQGAKQ